MAYPRESLTHSTSLGIFQSSHNIRSSSLNTFRVLIRYPLHALCYTPYPRPTHKCGINVIFGLSMLVIALLTYGGSKGLFNWHWKHYRVGTPAQELSGSYTCCSVQFPLGFTPVSWHETVVPVDCTSKPLYLVHINDTTVVRLCRLFPDVLLLQQIALSTSKDNDNEKISIRAPVL